MIISELFQIVTLRFVIFSYVSQLLRVEGLPIYVLEQVLTWLDELDHDNSSPPIPMDKKDDEDPVMTIITFVEIRRKKKQDK